MCLNGTIYVVITCRERSTSDAAAATAMLPPRAAAVAMKTPAVTAIVGAQTTINNQLKSGMATETATMTVTAMRMETKATSVAAAAEARRQRGGGGQLGKSAALAAVASLAVMAAAWRERGICGGGHLSSGSLARARR